MLDFTMKYNLRRLMYCEGVDVNVRLVESHSPVILDTIIY